MHQRDGSRMSTVAAVMGASAERPFGVDVTMLRNGELGGRQPVPGFGQPNMAAALEALLWDERDLDFRTIGQMMDGARREASLPADATVVMTCMRDVGRSCALKCTVADDERQPLAAFDGRGQPWAQPLVPRADCPAMDLPMLPSLPP